MAKKCSELKLFERSWESSVSYGGRGMLQTCHCEAPTAMGGHHRLSDT